jgi:hypothetical protein
MTTMSDLTLRPFEVHVPEEDLVDLQRRITVVRWPSRELVADRSQGVQLATLRSSPRDRRPAHRPHRPRRSGQRRLRPGAAVAACFGFSGEPTEVGWDPGRTARAWAELMGRLGYNRYVAQGGDVGAVVPERRLDAGSDASAGIGPSGGIIPSG